MPSCARSEIIPVGEVGVFHCWARCVRRTCLCGFDPVTRTDYEYRRDWIQQLEQQLAGLFAIETGFHAEMSNHLHVVLRARPDVAETWSDEDVVRRWLKIAKLKRGSVDFAWEPADNRVKCELAKKGRAARLRRRLSKVSWYMGALCENLARRANKEDHIKGHFFEQRFCSRDLVDESAILVCGIYVDLNQIRAGEAQTPEESVHTSAYERILGQRARDAAASEPATLTGATSRPDAASIPESAPPLVVPPGGWLCELTLAEGSTADVRLGWHSHTPWRASDKGLLPISLPDYLELLEWTGRQVRSDKPGAIPNHLAPILERLHINQDHWVTTIQKFDTLFGKVVGTTQQIVAKAARIGRRWLFGTSGAAQTFD